MSKSGLLEKRVEYAKDIAGQLIGKERQNINKIKNIHKTVRVVNKRDGKYPYFMLYGSSLDEINKCGKDLEKQINNISDTLDKLHIQKRVERELQRAKRKAEVERNIRDKIIRELEEQDSVKNTKEVELSKNDIVERIKTTNPFSALMMGDDSDNDDDNSK